MATTRNKTRNRVKLFNGRDHSWMEFNRRVLEEAEDQGNPLLERVKFLAITGSNLDEYVEMRQAGLMQRIEDGYREPGYDGLRPEESLTRLTADIHAFRGSAVPLLERAAAARAAQAGHPPAGLGRAERRGARLCSGLLSARSRSAADADDDRSGASVSARAEQGAVPGAAAAGQAAQLGAAGAGRGDGAARAAAACAAAVDGQGHCDYILLQDLIAQQLAGMYRGYEVLAHASFRVTRNSNLYFQEEEARSLLETMRVELHNRRKGDAVRLEIESRRRSGDRRAAARELRARRVPGVPHRRAGESVAR